MREPMGVWTEGPIPVYGASPLRPLLPLIIASPNVMKAVSICRANQLKHLGCWKV